MALVIIVCCALAGHKKSVDDRQNIISINEFIKALNIMICELEFHRSPLPTLCSFVSERTEGVVSKIFTLLNHELAAQVMPDVSNCCSIAIQKCSGIPSHLNNLFCLMGESLGIFDVAGQVSQLRYVKSVAEKIMEDSHKHYERFGRSNQTLWICAGIALAVILI